MTAAVARAKIAKEKTKEPKREMNPEVISL